MQAVTFFRKELIEASRKPRSLALKLVFPSLFAVPIIASGAPRPIAAGVIAMITLMAGIFGTGVALTKDRTDGIMARVLVTPVSSRRILLGQLGASALIEVAQLAPIVAFVAAVNRAGFATVASLFAITLITVVSVNLIGLLTSALAASSGEIHLFSTLAVFPLIGISGIFRAPISPVSAMAKVALISPITYFYQALLASLGVSPSVHAGQALIGSIAVALVLFALVNVLADRIVRREIA